MEQVIIRLPQYRILTGRKIKWFFKKKKKSLSHALSD